MRTPKGDSQTLVSLSRMRHMGTQQAPADGCSLVQVVKYLASACKHGPRCMLSWSTMVQASSWRLATAMETDIPFDEWLAPLGHCL